MLKVLKNLKKSWVSVIGIILLLCIQAAADLALPDYTSKIVNKGIQAGGIENAVPKVIAKEDMDALLIFSEEDENILEAYELVGNEIEKDQEKTLMKYFGKDYKIEENTIYILKDLQEEELEEMEKLLINPLLEMTTVTNEETAKRNKN